MLQSYVFDIIHVSTKQNLIPDILTRQNEVLQKQSRVIHMAKKDILDGIRQRVTQMQLPDTAKLSSKKVTHLLASVSNTDLSTRIEESIMHAKSDLSDASVISAVSLQPGGLPLETLQKLQDN